MEFRDEIFISGGINTDDDPRAMPKGDYRAADYTLEGEVYGSGFSLVTAKGTTLVNEATITSSDKILGSCVWVKRNAIVYLVYKASGDDEIWMYDISTGTISLICASADFNFFPDYPFFHCNIIDDILKIAGGKWDDAQFDPTTGQMLYNPPMQINLQKALDGDYPVIDLQVIDAIKWPALPPVAVYGTDLTKFDNKLRRKLFKFRIDYIYENNEEATWSMYSNLALPTQSELVSGTNWGNSQADNKIVLSFDTGPNVVKKINVAVQQFDENGFGAVPEFGVFLQINKALDGISDSVIYDLDFFGGVSTKPITNATPNYSRLPIWSRCQEYLPTNQLTYVNYREGYDKEEIDVTSEYVLSEQIWNPNSDVLIEGDFNAGGANFRIYSDYDILTFPFVEGMTFTFTDIDGGFNSYTLTEDDITNALAEATVTDQNVYIFQVVGDAFAAEIGSPSGTASLSGGIYRYLTTWSGTAGLYTFFCPTYRQTLAQPSLKVGGTHEFGIVYYDRGFRDGTVLTSEGMSLFVPWYSDIDTSSFTDPNNAFTVSARFNINHVPPIWAKYYSIVARPTTEIASFGQWAINYPPVSSGSNSAILPAPDTSDRFQIFLDNYYVSHNVGATINHQPQKGDIARFVRKRLSDTDPMATAAYITDYFEVEVLDVPTTTDADGRPVIIVQAFDLNLLDPDTYVSQIIEIYTPRPALDTDGTLFVSEWREVTGALEIGDPHTDTRHHHGSPGQSGLVVDSLGGSYWWLEGDVTADFPTGQRFQVIADGVTYNCITYGASYDAILDQTRVSESEGTPLSDGLTGIWRVFQDQVVVDGVSTQAAVLDIGYGDVYVRQRYFATGFDGNNATAFWFIEDPNYSDYWVSDVHNTGRLAVEDPNARMIQRQAAIHSNSFIVGTQINGLSMFELSGNVQDFNPVHGEVVRAYLSGREDKTLKCIQERKENSVYINHYPNDVQFPSGDLRVNKSETFSAWYPYKGYHGCSDSGATALLPNGNTVYFDRISGVFILSSTNGQVVISEIDPTTRNDYKFRKKTKELAARVNADPTTIIRTYVDELNGLVAFAFRFADGNDIVAFDYIKGRWRTYYNYNFIWFANFGNTLVGWGYNNQLYLHNQDSIYFHGDSFTQRIVCVSNENPTLMKRYQDFIQRSNKTWNVRAYAEENQSYTAMETYVANYNINVYEGYSQSPYFQNRFTPNFASEELALINGEDMRANALTHELTYDPIGGRAIFFSLASRGVIS